MTNQTIDTVIYGLRSAIADIGELLEEKRSRFQALGIDADELDRILTGRHTNPHLRHRVLQELNGIDQELREQVTSMETPPVIDPLEPLIKNYHPV